MWDLSLELSGAHPSVYTEWTRIFHILDTDRDGVLMLDSAPVTPDGFMALLRSRTPGFPIHTQYYCYSPLHPLFYSTVKSVLYPTPLPPLEDYKHPMELAGAIEIQPMLQGYKVLAEKLMDNCSFKTKSSKLSKTIQYDCSAVISSPVLLDLLSRVSTIVSSPTSLPELHLSALQFYRGVCEHVLTPVSSYKSVRDILYRMHSAILACYTADSPSYSGSMALLTRILSMHVQEPQLLRQQVEAKVLVPLYLRLNRKDSELELLLEALTRYCSVLSTSDDIRPFIPLLFNRVIRGYKSESILASCASCLISLIPTWVPGAVFVPADTIYALEKGLEKYSREETHVPVRLCARLLISRCKITPSVAGQENVDIYDTCIQRLLPIFSKINVNLSIHYVSALQLLTEIVKLYPFTGHRPELGNIIVTILNSRTISPIVVYEALELLDEVLKCSNPTNLQADPLLHNMADFVDDTLRVMDLHSFVATSSLPVSKTFPVTGEELYFCDSLLLDSGFRVLSQLVHVCTFTEDSLAKLENLRKNMALHNDTVWIDYWRSILYSLPPTKLTESMISKYSMDSSLTGSVHLEMVYQGTKFAIDAPRSELSCSVLSSMIVGSFGMPLTPFILINGTEISISSDEVLVSLLPMDTMRLRLSRLSGEDIVNDVRYLTRVAELYSFPLTGQGGVLAHSELWTSMFPHSTSATPVEFCKRFPETLRAYMIFLSNGFSMQDNSSFTFEAYLFGVKTVECGTFKERIGLLFKCLDHDRNGIISRDDFTTHLTMLKPYADLDEELATWVRVLEKLPSKGVFEITLADFETLVVEGRLRTAFLNRFVRLHEFTPSVQANTTGKDM